MVLEVCKGAYDFKSWLEMAGMPQIGGLVPNAKAKNGEDMHVNHAWRVVRRGAGGLVAGCMWGDGGWGMMG